jgi:hypothetical protein
MNGYREKVRRDRTYKNPAGDEAAGEEFRPEEEKNYDRPPESDQRCRIYPPTAAAASLIRTN